MWTRFGDNRLINLDKVWRLDVMQLGSGQWAIAAWEGSNAVASATTWATDTDAYAALEAFIQGQLQIRDLT